MNGSAVAVADKSKARLHVTLVRIEFIIVFRFWSRRVPENSLPQQACNSLNA
jgi:hypothetical protein